MNEPPRIAVIDDEPELLELFRHELDPDFTVSGFGDVSSAMDGLRQQRFDAVFVDIYLPDGNGLELLRRFREASGAPVLMMTSSTDRSNIISALRLGARDYLEKPIDFLMVRRRLEELIDHRPQWSRDDIPPVLELAPDISLPIDSPDLRLRLALAFVHHEYAGGLSLSHMARALNLSPYYLSRLIKIGTGRTFKDILCRHRLHHASVLLRTTNLRVSEVSRACGFSNFHYFCRLFRRIYGHAAGEHRVTS
jgi:YesN/AraC family two-component response regulator